MTHPMKYEDLVTRMQVLEEELRTIRAEKEAFRSEAEIYENLLNMVQTAVTITRANDGVFRLVNETFCQLTGYSRDEVLGQKSTDLNLFAASADREKLGVALRQNEHLENVEVNYRTRDGHILETIITVSFIQYRDERCVMLSATPIGSLKKAKSELQEREEQYRLLVETVNEGICITQDGFFRFVNNKIQKLLQYTEEEMLKLHLKDITHPEDRNLVVSRQLRRQSGEQPPPVYEFRLLDRNGQIVWVETHAVKIRWHGSPAVLSMLTNLTERKQYEEKLRQSEESYRNIMELAPDVITITGLEDGRYKQVNHAFTEVTGFTAEEVVNRTIRDINIYVNPNDRHLIVDAIRDHGQARGLQIDYRGKSGERIKGLISACPIMFQGEMCMMFIATDITHLAQAQQALRASEEKYRTIIDQMEDGYFEVDLEGNFTFVNDAECKILGYSRDELIGMNFRHYLSEKSAQKISRLFGHLYRTGIPVKALDLEVIRKNGSKGFHEVSAVLIKGTEGSATGVRGICRDITERRQAEEEKQRLEDRLNRAKKMEALGQLAGGVAHDLNNVLGVLTGHSELLLLEIPEGQRGRRHVEKIMQSTEKGAAIIQDLLTLARRGVTSSEVINLNDIIFVFLNTPVFEKMQLLNSHVTFRTALDPNLLNIKGSPVHLEKTLMNLVSNAAESISDSGEVTIRTENHYLDKSIMGYDEVREGDYAVVTVSDTGTGIPAEHIEKIFEPFYTKKIMGRSGTGLGLAIVWGTVKDHNGYIDVQSRVGEGTTFTLYFPVTRESRTARQQKLPVEQYMGRGESILVVDDIPEQREVASGLLKRLGYKVHAVSGGEEALEYLKSNRADILVLDMIMSPGIDGLETYRKVLEISPRQKAILVSGFSETDRVREAQKLGAGAYVKKPYLLEKIGVAIRDELNR